MELLRLRLNALISTKTMYMTNTNNEGLISSLIFYPTNSCEEGKSYSILLMYHPSIRLKNVHLSTYHIDQRMLYHHIFTKLILVHVT